MQKIKSNESPDIYSGKGTNQHTARHPCVEAWPTVGLVLMAFGACKVIRMDDAGRVLPASCAADAAPSAPKAALVTPGNVRTIADVCSVSTPAAVAAAAAAGALIAAAAARSSSLACAASKVESGTSSRS